MNLYLLMTSLFVGLAIVGAVDASLTSWTLLPWFHGLRWLRVHLITLGAVTETLFGVMPYLVAIRHKVSPPTFRWDIWLTLNGGILTLLVGIPIINPALIFTGGTLVFVATLLLIQQLSQMRPSTGREAPHDHQPWFTTGRPFYIAGLSYLLLGILIGTGLWLGWSDILKIKVPVEVHIHANNWGFISLVFAGLLVDLYPRVLKKQFAWPRSIPVIFWLMTVGALGLVLGPWVKSNYLSVPGLVMHLTATIWLLLNVVKPVWGEKAAWAQPGLWHIVTAYFWILAPVLAAPLIILGVPGFPGVGIEKNAPQALIYGWVFQFAYAFVPYFFNIVFDGNNEPRLGGSWLSLLFVHLGGVFLWVSIFSDNYQPVLHGTAYALWVISILPIAVEMWRLGRRGWERLAETAVVTEIAS